MSYPRNGGIDYEVFCSGVVAQSIRNVHEQADREGRGDAMLDAFREAVRQLKKRPLQFGEPLYRLPVLRMRIRHALIRPIAIQFGVCEDRPLIFIKSITLLSLPDV
jgi:hypothetical protein